MHITFPFLSLANESVGCKLCLQVSAFDLQEEQSQKVLNMHLITVHNIMQND